jgi:hypothetical protein
MRVDEVVGDCTICGTPISEMSEDDIFSTPKPAIYCKNRDTGKTLICFYCVDRISYLEAKCKIEKYYENH